MPPQKWLHLNSKQRGPMPHPPQWTDTVLTPHWASHCCELYPGGGPQWPPCPATPCFGVPSPQVTVLGGRDPKVKTSPLQYPAGSRESINLQLSPPALGVGTQSCPCLIPPPPQCGARTSLLYLVTGGAGAAGGFGARGLGRRGRQKLSWSYGELGAG